MTEPILSNKDLLSRARVQGCDCKINVSMRVDGTVSNLLTIHRSDLMLTCTIYKVDIKQSASSVPSAVFNTSRDFSDGAILLELYMTHFSPGHPLTIINNTEASVNVSI